MEKKKKKSDYESTKVYTKNYNKEHINVQLNRELINKLKHILVEKDISVKSYIEDLISDSIKG